VQVAGVDIHGLPFEERTFTLSISRHGAFISLRSCLRHDDHVTVTNLGTRQSCPFRLCECGTGPFGEVTAWGMECLEPNSNFWRIHFPDIPSEPSREKTIPALIICAACHSREVAELSLTDYRTIFEMGSQKRDCSDCGAATEWRFIVTEAMSEANPSDARGLGRSWEEENRREKRIVAKLPIHLMHPVGGQRETTVTENVSKSGLCCAAWMPLAVGDVIVVRFEYGTALSEDESPARVAWRNHLGEGRKTIYGLRLELKAG